MYIVTGIPGTGKTTTAKAIAQKLPKSVYIGADDVQHFIVNGLVWPDEKPKSEARSQLELRDKNMIALANNYFRHGFTPVLDVVIAHKDELERYISGLDVSPMLIILNSTDKVVSTRDAGRNKHVFDRWAHLRAPMKKIMKKGVVIDNASIAPDELADLIIKKYGR